MIGFYQRVAVGAVLLVGSATFVQAAVRGAEELEKGKRLYQGQCARCHGIGGGGGEGPALNQPKLGRGAGDKELTALIKSGIPAQGMPAARMSDGEVSHLLAYIRSLGRTPTPPAPGNPQRGMAIYEAAACALCHIIRGSGSGFGPELTEIGMRRAPEHLKQSVIDPGASLPHPRRFVDYLVVRVVTADGREIRGIRVNEDTLTIQLRDVSSKLYSFRKQELKEIEKQIGQSLMPSYRDKLSDSELVDLVAYLSSLRGEK
jgi:putative heme-binding domain-containing protein